MRKSRAWQGRAHVPIIKAASAPGRSDLIAAVPVLSRCTYCIVVAALYMVWTAKWAEWTPRILPLPLLVGIHSSGLGSLVSLGPA